MPEGLEVEIYRRAAHQVVGRTIVSIEVDARQAMPGLAPALEGERVRSTDRVGKVLLLTTTGPAFGVHFGMTGRLIVDERAPIERLEYASPRDDPTWDRLVVRFGEGGSLRVNDQRRWARFDLDPDVSQLGPDLFRVTPEELTGICSTRRRAVKAVLLDQRLIAGLGNMCVDEVLWHAGIAPMRSAVSLTRSEIGVLHGVMSTELPAMLERGGSHTGVLTPAVRAALPICPADGGPLVRDQVGGRSTVWCPRHQS